MAFVSHPLTVPRHLHRLPLSRSLPSTPPNPILRRTLSCAQDRNHNHGPSKSRPTPTPPKRGWSLFQSDLRRLGRFLRGDIRAFDEQRLKLHRYDKDKITDYYDARPITAAIRAAVVGLPFLVWLLRVRRIDPFFRLSSNPKVTARRAQQLRDLLCWAGPTYLKIGQAIGNRPDLVGAVYSYELQKLVDDVGTFDTDVALQMVKDELKLEQLSDVFKQFDQNAVASASLGQVHRAQLQTGEHVAVKIQRPTAERDAALDVYVLRSIAGFAKRRFKLRSDVVGIVDEFAARLWEELDYVNEADNCKLFEELYAKDNDDLYVPKVYRQYTSKRVLCLEWIDGDKAPWYPKEEARRLIRIGVNCSLDQLLQKGFVHADPHTGNLLRTKDGKLCYLDFGMCVHVKQQIRYDLIAAITRLINRDFENLAEDFIKLGFLPRDTDTRPFAPLLVKAFGDASTGSSLSDLSFSRLADNLSGLAFATPIRIPVFFTLIIRSLTILEGFALQIDASFKIVDETYPYVVKRILTDDSPVFQQALKDVLIDDKSGRLRWKRLNALLRTRSSSVQDDGPEISPAGTWQENSLSGVSDRALTRVVDFVLSERGAFLRQALMTELTDTADAVQLAFLKRISDVTRGTIPPPRDNVNFDRVDNAIALAQALRVRAPELFSTSYGTGAERSESIGRLLLLRKWMDEASRTVVGGILERNTRRVLRSAISLMFGNDRSR